MDDIIKKRIEEWTKEPFDRDTISEIEALVAEKRDDELLNRFSGQLEFGTGGLRGIIGAGTNRMNIYTVGMATQGLAEYIKKCRGSSRGVVIARDSRIMSDEFARETASIFAENGIKVYLFKEITPVPFASFAVRELGAIGGVIITASHNPPEYNGYKVYWDDGSQIVPPHDNNIISEVKKIDSLKKIKKTDFDGAIERGLIEVIGSEMTTAYLNRLEKAGFRERKKSNVKIVFTPIHGTGYKVVPEVLEHFGFTDLNLVEEQSFPDGNFPTVDSPNPEEESAMSMALQRAAICGADIVLATDPDSDRMGVSFRDGSGKYILINGNQIGTMLLYYIVKRSEEEGSLPVNGAVIKTIVTTELQREIAESYNLDAEDVLTGFKWIAGKMREYEESGEKIFVFGGEESYGYLPVSFVRDKDAVSSCYFFAEMTDWLQERGETLWEFLNSIYIRYGMYLEDLHSMTLKGADGSGKIEKIMMSFRSNPPKELGGIGVESVSDILTLKRKRLSEEGDEDITGLPSSNVLQFFLEDGTKVTMRPSGTEPKIKFYFSVREEVKGDGPEATGKILREKLKRIKKDFLKRVSSV
jgi:phosphoglucomutase